MPSRPNDLFLKRLREKLSETISHTVNANTSGATHVLQRADGSMLCDCVGSFSHNLSQATAISPAEKPILGGKPVAVEVARAKLISIFEDSMAEVNARLNERG